MRLNRPLYTMLIISLLLISGCSERVSKSEDPKRAFIKSYMIALFDIDKKLVEKYRYKVPLPLGQDPPTLYVDQRYIRDNPRLSRFTDKSNLTNLNANYEYFAVPIGMDLSTDDRSSIGKVADIKKVEAITIENMGSDANGFRYRVTVETIVGLDNRKEAEVMFVFQTVLNRAHGLSDKYVIESATFDTTPWLVNEGFWFFQNWQGQSIRVNG